jgi:hypothetical protein
MKKHLELLGISFIVYSVLTILILFLVLLIFFTMTANIDHYARSPHFNKDEIYGLELAFTIIFFICSFFILLAIPGIIAGIGLVKKRPWSRILALIVACFKLLNLPFGTALGIYAFWVLLQEETIELLSNS